MIGPIAIGVTGLFLFAFGIWQVKKDIYILRMTKDFNVLLFLFSITVPLISIIIGLVLILIFLYIIWH